jgi:hypothetical protein
MHALNLFPTKVVFNNLLQDTVLELVNKYTTSNSKDWEELIEDNSIVIDLVEKYYEGKYEICEGWIRSGYTSFDIHCDSHYGNQLVCVVQLYGDEGKGGDLVLYDPSWSNPQWVSDSKNSDSNTYVIPFKSGQIIVFPSNVWHRVTEYTGSISRITLNLMLRRVS